MELFVVLLFWCAVQLTSELELKCRKYVSCPCGHQGRNVSVCVTDSEVFHAEMCTKFSRCKSCVEGSDVCFECPEGFEGPFCDRERTLIRQKRQFALPDRRPIRPRPWSVPERDVNSCSPLDASNLGSIVCVKNSLEEEECTGKCWAGYHFVQLFQVELTLTCRRGFWEPYEAFPDCRRNPLHELIYCPDPGINAFSVRKPSKPPSRFGFPQGTPLEYSCDQGYELSGQRNLFCFSSGNWSESPPRCVAKSTTPRNPLHETIYCPDPGINAFSVRKPSMPPSRFGFPLGSSLEYSCDQGYKLSGQRNLFCLTAGNWSESSPRCVAESTTPRNPLHETIYCPDPGINTFSVRKPSMSPSRLRFPVGSSLEYSCDQGYELSGQRNLFCFMSGRWSGSPPKCVAESTTPITTESSLKYCTDPGLSPNSFRRPSTLPTSLGFIEGSRLEYTCDQVHILTGEKTLLCQASGKWTASLPTCIKRYSTYEDFEDLHAQECTSKTTYCFDVGGPKKCFPFVCPRNFTLRKTNNQYNCYNCILVCNKSDAECLNDITYVSYACATLRSNRSVSYTDGLGLMEFTRLSRFTNESTLFVKKVMAPPGITAATRDNFRLDVTDDNKYLITLIKSIQGPQEIELNLIQKVIRSGQFLGKVLQKFLVLISEF